MTPVHACTFMPDVIVMHINGMMASQMMIVKNWMDGGDITCQLSGHAGCVYAIVPTIQNQELSHRHSLPGRPPGGHGPGR